MTHRLVLAAAKIDLDLLAPNILPELAVELLIEGLDGSHLVRLAGESPASHGDDLDALLGDVLQELGLERLSRVEAARAVRDDIARQVVSGSIDGIDGAARLWEVQTSLESHLKDWRDATKLLGSREVIGTWYELDDCGDAGIVPDSYRFEINRRLVELFAGYHPHRDAD